MILISYDISDNKKRTKFSKYLSRFGHRIQYSVFEFDHSERMLKNLMADIENQFSKVFDESDSIYIFKMSGTSQVIRYGYPRHDEDDLQIIQ